jgi:CysZ protein
MIAAFAKAVRQLPDPAFRRVLVLGIGLTLAAFAVLIAVVWWSLTHTAFFTSWWMETTVDFLGGVAVIAIVWLLFPAIASLFVGLFLEDVVAAVEARHYPDEGPSRPLPIKTALLVGLRFAGVTVALNLLALPLYALALLLAPLGAVVFYGMNGYLLGREYYELVALRRLDPASAAALRLRHKPRTFLFGVITTFLLTMPVVNLVAPLVGAAAMVHLFRGMRMGAQAGVR